MKPRIGISHYSIIDEWKNQRMNFADFVEFSHSLEVDGIEILDAFFYEPGVVRDHLPNLDRQAEIIEELESSLKKTHLQVHTIAVTNDFSHEDPARLRVERSKIAWGIELAKRLSAGCVRIFAGNCNSSEDADLIRYRTIDALNEFENSGVRLALENHGNYFNTIDRLNTILEPVNHRHVGICFDAGNFLLAGADPAMEASHISRPFLVHLKDFCKDANGPFRDPKGKAFSGCRLGEGLIPIHAVLKQLWNPDLVIDLELECGEDGLAATRAGVLWLKELLVQHQPE